MQISNTQLLAGGTGFFGLWALGAGLISHINSPSNISTVTRNTNNNTISFSGVHDMKNIGSVIFDCHNLPPLENLTDCEYISCEDVPYEKAIEYPECHKSSQASSSKLFDCKCKRNEGGSVENTKIEIDNTKLFCSNKQEIYEGIRNSSNAHLYAACHMLNLLDTQKNKDRALALFAGITGGIALVTGILSMGWFMPAERANSLTSNSETKV